MHPNQVFRKQTKQQNIKFARQRSFGILSINSENGPLISHIPFQLSQDGSFLEAHLVRSNPIVRLLESSVDAVIAVCGPNGYISPDWYWVEDQVPTWNYVAVHVRGVLKRLQDDELRGVLERLSADMEERLLPKKPWIIDKMTPAVFEKMKRQIVPIAMNVSDIEGTWKLSQNKPESAIQGAITGVKQSQVGSEINTLAELMNDQLKK